MAKQIQQTVLIDFKSNSNNIEAAINKIKKQLSQMGLPEKTFTKFDDKLQDLSKDFIKIKKSAEEGFSSPKELNKFISNIQKFMNSFEQFGKNTNNLTINTSIIEGISKEFSKARIKVDELNNSLEREIALAKESKKEYVIENPEATTEKGKKLVKSANIGLSNIKKAALSGMTTEELLATIQKESAITFNNKKNTKGYASTYEQFHELAQKIIQDYALIQKAREKYDKAYEDQIDIENQVTEQFNKQKEKVKQNTKEVLENSEVLEQNGKQGEKSLDAYYKIGNQIDNFTSKIKYFTSAYMILNKVTQLIRQSFQEFYELDKLFNDISIVTGQSMEDMWQSFSKVNKTAQEYGVTTSSVVEVQNLYYHQGLSNAEVNRLTAETLTLAKISGLGFEDATNKMTAAMNAFNIASKDASIITDTFSALASSAATSTEELANAMTKTASIAANAGMDIQSTSVFLTKMIETTRESSENLGTALKTITARFTELKENVDLDEDGVVADFNRVDTALKTAGVNLVNTAGQFRDIDDVFMDLSKVWDTLDRNTQRYIATQAAGSRQQSRFIAMMEDYDRTVELMNVAQNAAGTGSLQLARSQESIETAINKLKSTWQEFYSHFLSSDLFKTIINIGNSGISYLNSSHTGLKTIIAAITAIIGLKTSEIVLDKLKLSIQGQVLKDEKQEERIQKNKNKHLLTEIALLKIRDKIGKTKELGINNQQSSGILGNLVGKGLQKIVKDGNGAAFGIKKETISALSSDFTKGYASISSSQKILVAINGILGTTGASIAGITAAIIAIPAIIVGIYQGAVKISNLLYKNKAEQSVKNLNEATSKYKDTLEKTNNTVDKYNRYQELLAKQVSRTKEEQEEFKTIQNEIAEIAPDMVNYYDAEGNAILKQKEELDKLIESKKEDLNLSRQNLNIQSRKAAQYGYFTEESSAGISFSNLVDKAAGVDITTMQEQKGWGLSKKDIKNGLETLAQATAFNRITFGKLTNDDLRQGQWDKIVTTIQENIGDRTDLNQDELNIIFADALKASGEYRKDKIDYLVELNEILGNTLINTFVEMADYVKDAAIQQGKSQISTTFTSNAPELTALEDYYIKRLDDQEEINKQKINPEFIFGGEKQTYMRPRSAGETFAKSINRITTLNMDDYSNLEEVSITAEEIAEKINKGKYSELPGEIQTRLEEEAKKQGSNIEEYIESLRIDSLTKETEKIIEDLAKLTKEERISFNKKLEKLQTLKTSQVEQIDTSTIGAQSNIYQELVDYELDQRDAALDEFKDYLYSFGDDFYNSIDIKSLNEATLSQLEILQEQFKKITSESGSNAGKAFLTSFNNILAESNLTDELEEKLYGLDWLDVKSVSAFRKQLKDSGIDLEDFDNAMVNAGTIINGTFETAEEKADSLNKKLETMSDFASNLTDAAKGSLSFEGLTNLINTINDENILSVKDFSATADGFGLSMEKISEIRKKEVEDQREELNHQAAVLRAKENITEEEEAQVLQIENQLGLMDLYVKYIDMITQKATLEAQSDKLKKIYDRLKSILDLLKSVNVWENLENLKDVLDLDNTDFQATIDLNLNADINTNAIESQIQNLTKKIATARGTKKAAENLTKYWSKEVSKSKYLDIGADGNLIKNKNYENLIKSASNVNTPEELEQLQLQIEQVDELGEKYIEAYKKAKEATKDEIDTLKELKNIQKTAINQMSDLSKTLLDIMISNDEKELSDYQKTADKKKEALDDYLSAVQESINKERNMRDLANKEEDLRQKQRKLSILQMDTSGMYAGDVTSLQKEISDDRRDLEDSYVDRYINDLSEKIENQKEVYDNDIQAWEEYLEWKKEDMTLYQEEIDLIISQGTDRIAEYINTKTLEVQNMTTQQLENFKIQTEETVNTAIGYYQALVDEGIQYTYEAIDIASTNTQTLEEATDIFANTATTDYDGVKQHIDDAASSISTMTINIQGALSQAWDNAKMLPADIIIN